MCVVVERHRTGVRHRHGVVVPDELIDQRVGTRCAPIAGRPAGQRGQIGEAGTGDVRVANDALEPPGACRVRLERVQERVVDTYRSVPSGDSPRKAKSGLSPACSTACGEVQVWPRSLESWTSACSWLSPAEPSDHPSAIVLGASAPVGAPLAMARAGKELVLAPAMPSKEIERTPSKTPTSVTCATTNAFSNVAPPSNDRDILNTLWCFRASSHTTYTTPWLSVLTMQPWRPPTDELLKDADSRCGFAHVVPPSVERVTEIDTGTDPTDWNRL